MVQLSHLYMTIGKTITLTIQTFASQVMSLGIEMGPLYWERRVLASEPVGKSTLWAFLRHVLTFSEAGFFTSLSLNLETFSLVQAYSSQKRFSLESAVSGSRMKFSTPFNFKPYHSFWEVTTWNMLVTCSSFVEKRSLIHWNWNWSVLVFRFVLLPRISLLMAHSLCCATETNTTL